MKLLTISRDDDGPRRVELTTPAINFFRLCMARLAAVADEVTPMQPFAAAAHRELSAMLVDPPKQAAVDHIVHIVADTKAMAK